MLQLRSEPLGEAQKPKLSSKAGSGTKRVDRESLPFEEESRERKGRPDMFVLLIIMVAGDTGLAIPARRRLKFEKQAERLPSPPVVDPFS